MKIFFGTLSFIFIFFKGYTQWPFVETAAKSGVPFHHYDPKLMGGGVVIFDYNNDGREDLYFTGGANPDKLFRNIGNGLFADVSDQTGITTGVGSYKTMGAVSGDLNNDGFKDIIVTTDKGQPNLVLKNVGGVSFEVITPFPNDPKTWSTSVILGDVNKDGYLDVYVIKYVAYDQDPFSRFMTGGLANVLYQNNGNFQFSDITQATGTGDNGAGTAGTFSDFDNDGDGDLFVVNDYGYYWGADNLLVNQYPLLQFTPVNVDSPVRVPINGMGIAIGDYNEDGLLDYYVTNYLDQANLLLTNTGNSFIEQSLVENVQDKGDVSWGAFFFDFDNDSYLDLFVANGNITNPTVPSSNRLFHNNGTGIFTDITPTNLSYNENTFRGTAFGDLNNDGFLDVVVVGVLGTTTGNNPDLLLMNQGTENNNWIKLRMKGTISNRDGYGARVELFFGGRKLIREVDGGSSYLSQNSSVVHFGLGISSHVDSLHILWPNGLKEKYYNLEANQYLEAVENVNLTPVDVITGITQETKHMVFPNPFNDYIQITLTPSVASLHPNFYLFNMMGQKMQGIVNIEQMSPISFRLQVDHSLPNELYLLRIEAGGKLLSSKVIKNPN